MNWYFRVALICVLTFSYAGVTGCRHDTHVEDGHGHRGDHHDDRYDDHHDEHRR